MIAVTAGDSYSLALKADGRVVAWGSNGLGQCTPPWQRLTPLYLLLIGN
jgi:alpha-tubulin suppressor-like RCC1 family protein